jgi:predicted DNA-binding ribbon-helix-helix protein
LAQPQANRQSSEHDAFYASTLVANIDTHRQYGNLSSAIRLFVLDHFRARTVLDSIDQPNRSDTPDAIATNGSYKVAISPG